STRDRQYVIYVKFHFGRSASAEFTNLIRGHGNYQVVSESEGSALTTREGQVDAVPDVERFVLAQRDSKLSIGSTPEARETVSTLIPCHELVPTRCYAVDSHL